MRVVSTLSDMVRVVSRHGGGAQLCVMGVRVMVGVARHRAQVGSAIHAAKIRGGVRGRVALGVAGSLVVGHGV